MKMICSFEQKKYNGKQKRPNFMFNTIPWITVVLAGGWLAFPSRQRANIND